MGRQQSPAPSVAHGASMRVDAMCAKAQEKSK
jgi:hypothetical protein